MEQQNQTEMVLPKAVTAETRKKTKNALFLTFAVVPHTLLAAFLELAVLRTQRK